MATAGKHRAQPSRAESFLAGFVHPLVAGGELHVGAPLGVEELAELRAEAAVQSKLDALATGMLEAIRKEGQQADPMLERAIGIDEQL
jgi:hypothetical protein